MILLEKRKKKQEKILFKSNFKVFLVNNSLFLSQTALMALIRTNVAFVLYFWQLQKSLMLTDMG